MTGSSFLPGPRRPVAGPSRCRAAGSRPAADGCRSGPRPCPRCPAAGTARTAIAIAPRPTRYQTPGCRAELVLDDEEDDRAEDRPLERAEPADQHHEDHVRRPLHAEDRVRLDSVMFVASQSAPATPQPERGEHEDDALAPEDADAERRGRVLVVADRLQRRARCGCAAGGSSEQRRTVITARAEPVGVGAPVGGVVHVERDQRRARPPVHCSLSRMTSPRADLGDDPHADRELAAAQPQHEAARRHRRPRRPAAPPSTSAG